MGNKAQFKGFLLLNDAIEKYMSLPSIFFDIVSW